MTAKNKSAVALGKRRAATLTPEHQSAASRSYWDALTPEQRAERTRKAWETRRARKAAK